VIGSPVPSLLDAVDQNLARTGSPFLLTVINHKQLDDMNPLAALRTIQADAVEIAYEESGRTDGIPVVLLHGFPDDPRSWDGLIGPLSDAGCRTIVPYLRGFGATRFRRTETLRSGQQAALAHDLVA
jgi:hypothetical protein